MSLTENEVLEFKGVFNRTTYENNDFRIMSIIVKGYDDIKRNKYGDVTITGEMHKLDSDTTYNFKAIEEKTKYGYSYKIVNISREKPVGLESTYEFLREILTFNQATELFKSYPNIIELVMNNEEIDLSQTKGIKEKTFEKIKNKIIENFSLVELVSEFKGYVSLSIIKKLYQTYTSVEMVRSMLTQDPYHCFCALSGIGFKSADKILLDMQKNKVIDFGYDLISSFQRCMSCIVYVLQENENDGHTRMEIALLRNKVLLLSNKAINNFVECLKNEEKIKYMKTGSNVYVSRRYTYDCESEISSIIKNAINNKVNKFSIDINEFKIVDGIELSDKQLSAIENVTKYAISILNGFSGCGKSYTTKALLKAMDKLGVNYSLLAPTGKAAKVLTGYTSVNAETIHRALGFRPPNNYVLNEDNQFNCDLIVIDEFSMVDIFLFRSLIKAIDFNKTRIMIIGDDAQLPSVQCGNLLHDFLKATIIPTITLTTVFRYGDGGLMKVATDIRNSDIYLDNIKDVVTTFGKNKDYTFINIDQSTVIGYLVSLYKKLLEKYKPEDIYVLSAYKKGDFGSFVINNYLQTVANKEHLNDLINIKSGDITFYKEDIIIQNVNNYKAEEYNENCDFNSESNNQIFIANGETGYVENIDGNSTVLNYNSSKVVYEKGDMLNVDLGYAMTTHRSQGSQNKVVILLTPKAHTFMLNSNLIYVAVTRAQEKCFHIGTTDVVNTAIKKKENFDRNTWMVDLLKLN